MQISYLVTCRKKNPQGNKNLPQPACPTVALLSRCRLLYQDRRPAQWFAGEEGPGG
jgi:hypothetical protein